jgi:uncharacterized protein YqjF (DUF2071 family)
MKQTWHDLLFAHWPIPPVQMHPLVPAELTLDTLEGNCWVGVIPFSMSGIRARTLPPIPGHSAFPELNVRTYVTYKGKPGVYFFSLDAANRAAVWAARQFYRLPYFHADMTSKEQTGTIHYSSRRLTGSAEFRATYKPISQPSQREKGTIEHWLTERYCLYTVHQGKVYRCDIHHLPWPLQDAIADIQQNTVAAASKIVLPGTPPLLQFAKQLEVLIWPLRPAADTRV